MTRIRDDRDRNRPAFRGICLEGPFRGKEIEGKLNIELDIESIKPRRSFSNSGFGSIVILLLLLGINYVAVKGTDFRGDRPTEESFPQELPQYGEPQFRLEGSN